MIRKILMAIGGLIAVAAALVGFGPKEPVDETITFTAASIGSDVDAYLAASEARIPDIIDGAQKQIVWADPAAKSRTPISLVYIHGFSASLEETRLDPETLYAWELGYKGSFWDNRIQLDASAFTYVYEDLQQFVTARGVPTLDNAPESEIDGLDARDA